MRTFIAFKLPDSVINSLKGLQNGLKKRGLNLRWVRAENIHLTLKFLGDVPDEAIEEISAVVRETAQMHPLLTLTARGLGVFPSIKEARVMWAGIHGDVENLKDTHRELGNRLAAIGFEPEKRPFRGHLTLGRVKGRIDPRELASIISDLGSYTSPEFEAGRLILFKSDLKPTGAVYTEIAGADLLVS